MLAAQRWCWYIYLAKYFLVLLGASGFIDIIQVADCRDICLFMPYVSSIADVSVVEAPPRIYRFSLEFELNYQHTIRMTDLILNVTDAKKITWVLQLKFELLRSQTKTISYRYDFDGPHTKESYTRALDLYFNQRNLDKETKEPIHIGNYCSRVYIYEASYKIGNNPASLLYHNSMRCRTNSSTNALDYFPESRYQRLGISSAAYREPFKFEFVADGHLLVDDFHPNFTPSLTNPLGGMVRTVGLFPRAHERTGEMSEFLADTVCSHQINKLTKGGLDNYVLEDAFKQFKPIGTFTNWPLAGDDAYLYYEMGGRNSNSFWLVTKEGAKLQGIPLAYGANLTYQAISISRDEPYDQIYAIFLNTYSNEVSFHRGYFRGETVTPTRIEGYAVPEDIAHWTTCEKVVSVYGFLYTLHNYTANILTDRSYWHKLDYSLFDYPIEAMHANGDEFWFFVKAQTVIVIKVDSEASCEKLVFIPGSKREYSLRKLLYKDNAQTLVDGRYFDIKSNSWIPPWVEPIEPESYLWYYLLGATALSVLIVLGIIFIALKGSEKRRGDVIFSKSLSSRGDLTSKTSHPQASHPPPAAYPDQHQSHYHSQQPAQFAHQADQARDVPLFSQANLKTANSMGSVQSSRPGTTKRIPSPQHRKRKQPPIKPMAPTSSKISKSPKRRSASPKSASPKRTSP